MKRINIYIAFLSGLLFASCGDFLDIKPVGKVIPTTYQDYRDLMTYAYSTFPRDRSLSTVRGDELQLQYDSWGDYIPYQSVFIWNDATPDPNTIAFPWGAFYKVILNANQVILNGEEATDGTQLEINQLRGEAYLMRAYTHFGLVSLFSDIYSTDNLNKKSIPLAVTIDVWKNYERNTIGEVYERIFLDIEEGIKLLNVDQQTKGLNYRFSKVSAYGLGARIYAYTGNWDKAREYALKAYELTHELVDLNAADALLPVNYASVENVLAMENTYESYMNNRFSISDKLVNAFDKDNDLRFGKYFRSNGKGGYSSVLTTSLETKVSMRTAEFYLLLAASEARVSNGDLTKAKGYLKQLLAKRLKPDYYNAEATAIDDMEKEAFIQRVSDERFRELACQGFRWYDLRYFGQPRIEKTFDGETYVLEQGDSRYILPFPVEAVAANPNLVNN